MTRLFLLVALLSASGASAQKAVYVATDGSALGSGALASPLNSIAAALTRVVPGDTIYVRGGTYASPSPVRLDASGEEGAYLHIWAYPGETPVFDFTGANRGFDVRGDYLHLKGLVAEKSGDNGVYVNGASYNILEGLVARYNGDSGVQMQTEAAYNLLLNIDSYENYDAGNNGENADGFAIKFGVGPGNVVRGCRSWGNSDDGYDFWSDDDPGQQGVLVEDSWAFRNGYNIWEDTNYQGDSNGFKLGHGPGAHTFVRNLSWGHRAHGFDVNGNESGVTLYNNTAVDNGGSNFFFDDDPNEEEAAPYVLRNNVSYGDVRMDQSVVQDDFNTWNGAAVVGPSDFLTMDDAGADGPRQKDGSLPDLDFLKLAPGSDLIDAGTDVGLPFLGSAPDLGAFESAATGTAAEADPLAPGALRLLGPNPVRHTARLGVDLAEAADVRLDVVDALGRRVATLLDGPRGAGPEAVEWDASALPSGVYVVRLQAGAAVHALTLTVVR